MKTKRQLVIVSLTLVLISAMSASRAFAQYSHDHFGEKGWRTGMLRISKSVWAGDVRLKSGMYHVTHVVDGARHVMVFKAVTQPAGYKEFGMFEEREAVRLECRVEPVTKSTRNTKLRLGKNSDGERMIEEIQIAGERVKHVLLANRSS